MNMVEKVAKSLYPSFDKECICNRCNEARRNARAAIAAMMEPSEGMVEALMKSYDFNYVEAYKTMIDAALKEDKI